MDFLKFLLKSEKLFEIFKFFKKFRKNHET